MTTPPGDSAPSPTPDLPPAALRASRWLMETVGFFSHAALRFYNGNCFQTAASLTYTTLLAIVPLMTIGFAIFTAFPAFSAMQNRLQALIFRNMVPEIGDAILEYLGQFMVNAGQMTSFGVIGLAVSAILLMWTIEGSFASIWRVQEPRSLVTRILSFWALLTFAPLLFGVSLSLSSSLWSVLEMIHVSEYTYPLQGIGAVLPFAFQFAGCTFLYIVLPNRTVGLMDAVYGGLVGAALLELSKSGFGWYLRAYPAYQTIYGALSTVPIFLFWIFIGWSTVLFGAVVTAALPEWRAGRIARVGPEGLLPAQRLALALAVLHELMLAARLGVGMRRRTLVARVPVGSLLVEAILLQLRHAHWVALTTRDSWVVTRDLNEATVNDLCKALGIGMRGSVRGLGRLRTPWEERAVRLVEEMEISESRILSVTLKDLLTDATPGEGGAVPLRRRTPGSPNAAG